MKRSCAKCGSDDLCIKIQPEGLLITTSARGRHPSEFVYSSEYDYYWSHTVEKEHLLIHCRCCQHEWREACLDANRAGDPPIQESKKLDHKSKS